MFDQQTSKANEPQDIFADTVLVRPPSEQGFAGAPTEASGAGIPELAGPVFSPGKLWTTIGIIVIVLALVAGGVWWFWWRPKQIEYSHAIGIDTIEGMPLFGNHESSAPQQTQTPPAVVDTDGDGLTDTEEQQLGTNASQIDSDSDGLQDKEEVQAWKTNPLKADSDSDGYNDKQEIDNGYNPNGPGKLMNEQEDIKKLQQ